MLPPLRSHEQYLQFLNGQLNAISVPKAHQDVPEKLAILDLTPIRLLVLDLYNTETSLNIDNAGWADGARLGMQS